MPTVQATDDFNHAIDAGYYTDGFFGTPTAVSSPLYQSQPKSLEIITGAGATGVRENLTGTPTHGWMAFPFRTSAVADVIQVANFWAAGFSEAGTLNMTSTGLYVTLATDSTAIAISANTWYWVEMIYDVSANPHELFLKVGGTTVSTTSAVAATTVESAQLLGQFTPSKTFHYGLWKYGSAASDSDWLGEPTEGAAIAWIGA